MPRSRRAILAGVLLTAVAPLWAQIGRVRIRVTDQAGTVVPGAEVSLLGSNDQPIRTSSTDASGEVVWTGLSLGDARVLVTASGFSRQTLTVTHSGDEQKVETTLEVGTVGDVVAVQGSEPERSAVPQTLDLASVPAPPAAVPPKPPKRKWWRIF